VLAPTANFIRSHARLSLLIASLAIAPCAWLVWAAHSRPRAWAVREVPIAFWAWQSNAPAQADVERALHQTGARTLFMRAGQLDYERGTCRLIRAASGPFPRGVELHLVYNATPDLLAAFETIDIQALVSAIAETYAADSERAARGRAEVAGLQLDLDVPTRLLPKYEGLLRMLRERLPEGIKLSITGLPTWMRSLALATVLEAVDFWVPQCYGATIPEQLERATPIASLAAVADAIDGARGLGRPFYAGLAAYGYAIHYSPDGRRIQVSGTLDPELVANSTSLELVERRRFGSGENSSSEWRLVYRAREACVLGGLFLREGEWLMLDLPTAESLRAAARTVRERAGPRLLGVCVFRLPSASDKTTLTIEEVADALLDRPPSVALEVTAKLAPLSQSATPGERTRVEIACVNTGSTGALCGEDALMVEAQVPAGRLRTIELNGFGSSETLFAPAGIDGRSDEVVACGVRRANLVRLMKRTWRPGETAFVVLEFSGEPPDATSLTISVRRDERTAWQETRTVAIERENRW